MKKIRIIAIISITLLFFACHEKEKKTVNGNRIDFPSKIYGINFATLQIGDVARVLLNNRVSFTCYDGDMKEFLWTGAKGELERISSIVTDYFIGSGLDRTQIIDIAYNYNPIDEYFQFKIKMKMEYYNTLLESLNKQFGKENAYENVNGYSEISWYSNIKIQSDKIGSSGRRSHVNSITLSRRPQYGIVAELEEKRFCYLVITTSRNNPITR